jgi:hypothetical protein
VRQSRKPHASFADADTCAREQTRRMREESNDRPDVRRTGALTPLLWVLALGLAVVECGWWWAKLFFGP